jgi:hypothetical protein
LKRLNIIIEEEKGFCDYRFSSPSLIPSSPRVSIRNPINLLRPLGYPDTVVIPVLFGMRGKIQFI